MPTILHHWHLRLVRRLRGQILSRLVLCFTTLAFFVSNSNTRNRSLISYFKSVSIRSTELACRGDYLTLKSLCFAARTYRSFFSTLCSRSSTRHTSLP